MYRASRARPAPGAPEGVAKLPLVRVTSAVLAVLCLAGCSTTGAAAPEPTSGIAPAVKDVCATVDAGLADAVLGTSGLKGTDHSGTVGTVDRSQDGCVFEGAGGAALTIGIAPIAMATAIPGPEQAMRVYTRRDTYPEDDTIGGVGDLATYQVIGDDLIQLVAVRGSGVRWYGVTVAVTDPSTGHPALGRVTQADLVRAAKRSLARA